MSEGQVRPSEGELAILQILWEHGASTVRSVNDQLNLKRKVGYTTTLKLMQIMHDKGMLARQEEGRGHRYSPLIAEGETQKALLDRFVDMTFGGSAMKLVMQALGGRKTSKAELDEIKEYLEQLEERP